MKLNLKKKKKVKNVSHEVLKTIKKKQKTPKFNLVTIKFCTGVAYSIKLVVEQHNQQKKC